MNKYTREEQTPLLILLHRRTESSHSNTQNHHLWTFPCNLGLVSYIYICKSLPLVGLQISFKKIGDWLILKLQIPSECRCLDPEIHPQVQSQKVFGAGIGDILRMKHQDPPTSRNSWQILAHLNPECQGPRSEAGNLQELIPDLQNQHGFVRKWPMPPIFGWFKRGNYDVLSILEVCWKIGL